MPKSGRRDGRKIAKVRDERGLLDRILDTPHLAHIVPRLQPDVLHRVIQRCGLEDCSELVALATPDQLMGVFDLDLWRASRPGLDEQLDVDRFGVWLEVLMESGPAVAAQKLVGVDVNLVVAALAQHLLVSDRAAVASFVTTDGEETPPSRRASGGFDGEIGNYAIEARRTESWDAIASLLLFLNAEHHDYFDRVMRGCRSLSISAPEVDGLHDLLTVSAQGLFDLSVDRERRRETTGFITPAQASAFLQMSRRLPLRDSTPPPHNPVATAYFRAIEWTPAAPSEPNHEARALLAEVLLDAGVLTPPPRALLGGPKDTPSRLSRIQGHLQSGHDRGDAAYSTSTGEVAYLANTLVAGCSIQGRPFSPQEASDAAAAVCNLGLENWPSQWPPALDLITVFQVGWTVLHRDACLYTAERLIGVLADLRCPDRDIQAGIAALRVDLAKHWQAGAPWRARDSLDVIASLDMPAWAALLALIDEYPVLHAAVGASQDSRTRAVSASAFEFISENSQLAAVHAFMASLPATLRP